MDHADKSHGFTRSGEPLVVLTETTATTKPSEGSLNNPPAGEHDESLLVIAAFDDIEDPVAKRLCPLHQATCVTSIRPDASEPRKPSGYSHHDEFGPVSILDTCRMDDHGKQQARSVNYDMALTAIDFLAGIVATGTASLGRFHALAINDCSTGTGFSSHAYSHLSAQHIMSDLPDSSQPPLAEVVVYRLPFGEVVRQHTPLTTGAYHVENCIQDLS
jgi:hypothetical protein